MKRNVILLAFLATAGLAFAQSTSIFESFSKSLVEKQALQVNLTSQKVGGTRETITVELKKPNFAKIEDNASVMIADGKNISVFNKSENSYYQVPQTEAKLMGLFETKALRYFSDFFKAGNLKLKNVKPLADREKAGETLSGAQVVWGPNQTDKLWFGKNDSFMRQGQIDEKTNQGTETTIIEVQSSSSPTFKEGKFAFKAPTGSEKITEDEMKFGRWITDMEIAKSRASAAGKKLFVHFTAEWCTWCKKIEKETYPLARFKSLGSKFVFVRLNVDNYPGVGRQYNVTGLPTLAVLAADGSELGRNEGYLPTEQFFEFINAFL